MCCLTTSAAVQILGGSGYTTDYPVEQFYREARIHPIHEGTTGIHGLDLLGRKVGLKGGKALELFDEEVKKTLVAAYAFPGLTQYAAILENEMKTLGRVTRHLLGLGHKGVEWMLADATLYLELFGIVCIGWQWLKMGVAARRELEEGALWSERDFYKGKVFAMEYFFEYEVVKIGGLSKRLESGVFTTVEMREEYF